jgi:hypothetical protein
MKQFRTQTLENLADAPLATLIMIDTKPFKLALPNTMTGRSRVSDIMAQSLASTPKEPPFGRICMTFCMDTLSVQSRLAVTGPDGRRTLLWPVKSTCLPLEQIIHHLVGSLLQ